ncbi:uncharacterized protein FYW23_005402 isoform 2-T3 [Sylvia borin]
MSVSCCTLSLMGSFICKGLELISIIPSLIQLSLQIKRLSGCSLCAEDAAPGGEKQRPLPLCSHQPAVPLAQAHGVPCVHHPVVTSAAREQSWMGFHTVNILMLPTDISRDTNELFMFGCGREISHTCEFLKVFFKLSSLAMCWLKLKRELGTGSQAELGLC